MISHSELRNELIKIVGERNYSDSELDAVAYSSDAATLPPQIFKLYVAKRADCIVKPTATEQVAAVIRLAGKYKIPITPRGGASSGLGGAVPIKDGIVIDLTGMKQILELDESKKTVTVQPGITWKELMNFLNKKGLQPGIAPSSAYSATVGGFISTGGYFGIGAPKYGSIKDNIISLEVVLPNSEVINTATDSIPVANAPEDSSSLFTGAEGILGIITKATIRVYAKEPAFQVVAIGFDTFKDALEAINAILENGITPHTVHIVDGNFLGNLRRISKEAPNVEGLAIVALEAPTQSELEDLLNNLSKICVARGGRDLGLEVAQREWDERFKVELLFKRLGPTFLAIELLVPMAKASEIYRKWNEMAQDHVLTLNYFVIVGHGHLAAMLPLILVDERKEEQFIKTAALIIKLLSEGLALGGRLCYAGAYNTPYADKKFGFEVDELKKIKAALDPQNIMNPYKVVNGRFPPWLFKIAMRFMAASPAWLDLIAIKIAGAIL